MRLFPLIIPPDFFQAGLGTTEPTHSKLNSQISVLARFPIAPVCIGLVLGPMTEKSFRQASMLFKGHFYLMLKRPIALSLLLLAAAFLIFIVYRGRKLPASMEPEKD